jgi:nicotinamide-nucleotide amidase
LSKLAISIITIGDELLKGKVLNSHLAYMGSELLREGTIPKLQLTVRDNIHDIQDALTYCHPISNVIIITGGLGPTTDDITVQAVATFFNLNIIQNAQALEELTEFLKFRGLNISQENLKQTYIPENSKIILNPNGTAPGIQLQYNDLTLFLLPGPPNELIPMFKTYVLPYIQTQINEKVYFKSIYAVGVPESDFQRKVSEILKNEYNNFDIAFRANPGICELMISSSNKPEVDIAIDKIKEHYQNSILSSEFTHPAEEIAYAFSKNKWSLATAESCTGGMIAAKITDIPGVSSFFKGGCVVYSNELKEKSLNVTHRTLEKYGAVSAEAAEEMVIGLCKKLKTNAGIATTGIAGPDGGTHEKPVGLVYIGVKLFDKISVKKYQMRGNREMIRQRTVITALDQLRKIM